MGSLSLMCLQTISAFWAGVKRLFVGFIELESNWIRDNPTDRVHSGSE